MRLTKSQLHEILKKNKSISIEKDAHNPCSGFSVPSYKNNKDLLAQVLERHSSPVLPMETLTFQVNGNPVSAPRQTQRDKWMKRPCVMKYREYADRLRRFINLNDLYVGRLEVKFYLEMPSSWSFKKKCSMENQPHRVKSDLDNLIKGVQDALLKNDSMIWAIYAEKRWASPGKERTELTFSTK